MQIRHAVYAQLLECSADHQESRPPRAYIYVGFHMPPDLCAAWINLGAPRSGGQVDDIWVAPR